MSGSATGTDVRLHVVSVTQGHGGNADLTGSVSGDSMDGTFHTNEGDTGAWSVTR